MVTRTSGARDLRIANKSARNGCTIGPIVRGWRHPNCVLTEVPVCGEQIFQHTGDGYGEGADMRLAV